MINIQQLKDTGLKLTKHKLAMLNLFKTHKHLNANQIYELLRNQNDIISIATIYRILSTLEAKNILVKHNFADDQFTYELLNSNDHHDHLICIKCNNVIEFIDSDIEKLQNQIAENNNFDIISHSLNIYGICRDCK